MKQGRKKAGRPVNGQLIVDTGLPDQMYMTVAFEHSGDYEYSQSNHDDSW
jgi:hypothetical protein